MSVLELPEGCPRLTAVTEAQLRVFPEHKSYLATRFAGASPGDIKFADELATLITRISADALDTFCADYKWLVGVVLEEEIFFRRENRYRLSSFAEAEASIYGDRTYMTRYMNGLLLSQLWWNNHTNVLRYFRDVFLPANKPGSRHLEIGPGHGVFLYYAASDPRCSEVAGWDVSATSIDLVKDTFRALSVERPVALALVNMFDQPRATFESVTFSEVLEHLEEPDRALSILRGLLAPGGRAFINVPVNSPAPDHITLYRTPEDVVEAVRQAGFEIDDVLFAPTTGASLARARKLSLAISTVVVARNPER
jgi:2-polyprenyl-3-methyl-5-hydroxy-6-metoxy-1,4-benzoquinol methylase